MQHATRPADETSCERQAQWALLALSFFMADIQAGVGPFLGVFLLAKGWIAAGFGYRPALLVLGLFSLASVAPWIGFAGSLRPACAVNRATPP